MATKKQNKHFLVRQTRLALKRDPEFLIGKVAAKKLHRWRYGGGLTRTSMQDKSHE